MWAFRVYIAVLVAICAAQVPLLLAGAERWAILLAALVWLLNFWIVAYIVLADPMGRFPGRSPGARLARLLSFRRH